MRIDLENYKYLANIEYRNRLLGRISKYILHDISTPISVVSGYINMNNIYELKEERMYKESLIESLLYIENVLNGSLDIIKPKSKERSFYPNNCIKNLVKIMSNRLNKGGINVEFYLSGNTKLKGNRCSFCRIFLNLFINSVEELEISRKREKTIEIKTYVLNNYYILSIKDNGRGFKKELLEKFQNNDFVCEDENLGLGLFFVFDSVKNNFNGSVNIISKRWKYTKVEVCFPYENSL